MPQLAVAIRLMLQHLCCGFPQTLFVITQKRNCHPGLLEPERPCYGGIFTVKFWQFLYVLSV